MPQMNYASSTKEDKGVLPENLIDEVLKMDRLLYLKIIQKKESLTSLQMTREILALKDNLRPEQIENKEITRNNPNINKRLKDLSDLKILNDREGRYSLSPIGFLIIDELTRLNSNIAVLTEYKNFFDLHDYTVIPPKQFREIHKLRFAKQCKDAIEYTKLINENTQKTEYRICIVSERLHEIPSWIIDELKRGNLTLKLIYHFEEPFKLNYDDEEEQRLWKDLTQETLLKVELRYLALKDRNPIGIRIIDRGWAILTLPKTIDNRLDRPLSFEGTNKQFVNWVEDVFLDIWDKSKPLEIRDR